MKKTAGAQETPGAMGPDRIHTDCKKFNLGLYIQPVLQVVYVGTADEFKLSVYKADSPERNQNICNPTHKRDHCSARDKSGSGPARPARPNGHERNKSKLTGDTLQQLYVWSNGNGNVNVRDQNVCGLRV